MADANPVGRPTLYNKQLADLICAQVAEGASVVRLCQREDMPSRATVHAWLGIYPEFLDRYQAAYNIQMLGVFDELKDLVDECEVSAIAKVREQLKLRQWLLKIHEPKRFGDHPEPVEPPAKDELDLSLLTDEQYAAYRLAVRAATRKKEPNT